jgi:O-antigen/teichoic acid export membrane protein
VTQSSGFPGHDTGLENLPSIGHRFARGVFTTSLSQIGVLVLSIGTSIAQARILGSEGRGDVARFVNAGAVVVLYFGLGISSAITYFVASRRVRPAILFHTLRPLLVLTVVAVIASLVAVSVTPLQRFLPQTLPIGWGIALLAAFFALSQTSSWISAIHAGRAYFRPINISSIAAALTAATACAALLVFRPEWAGAWTIITLIVLSEALRASVLVAYLFRTGVQPPGGPGDAQQEPPGFAALIRYSALSFLADAVQLLTYRLDQWVVDAYHGAADLGRYAVAVSFAQLVWIIPSAAGRVLFPFSAMIEEPAATQLAWRAAKATFIIAATLGAAGWLVSNLFLTALLGEEFSEVPSLIGILLLGIVPLSVAKILGNYLAGRNALVLNLGSAAVILALTIALDLILIPGLGTVGAAWATAISYTAYTLLLIAIFLRRGWRSTSVEVGPRPELEQGTDGS